MDVTDKYSGLYKPLASGGANYEEIAPKHSLINAYQDFRNDPGELSKYLQDLIDDKRKYMEYFWWKDFYKGTYLILGKTYLKNTYLQPLERIVHTLCTLFGATDL